jgi:hypothetical protein
MSDPSTERVSRIPHFSSVKEEAEFWDTQDTTEFEDEWEEVQLEHSASQGHVLSVRLDREQFRRISAHPRAKGVGASTLARMWVLDRLDQADAETERHGNHRTSAD